MKKALHALCAFAFGAGFVSGCSQPVAAALPRDLTVIAQKDGIKLYTDEHGCYIASNGQNVSLSCR
jgi:hypothetical protein